MAHRIRIGNLYGIPLPNSKFAFGRYMRDASIAIYKHIGNDISDIPKDEDYQFIVGIYTADINKDLILIDNLPFENKEHEWPPPTYILDKISGEYEIYYRGEINRASKDKCIDMEKASIWHTNHIIDRILGDNKWGTKSKD
ncbi:hypothetical protein [Candidatus Clostridium radicumherbarum]|uniref:Uncharacterized protein n=1 Tax=Candidatus Clostridium radicumherbarum TaxID=3381662 RepID=A0ABW8TS26_9CLOT